MADLSAVVDRIDIVSSHGRTKKDFFERFTERIKKEDTDLERLINEANRVREQLENTGMFKNVFLTIDTSDMYDTKSSNGYQLIYEVEEKLVKAGTASHMDPTSGNPSFLSHITFPNILGRGEKLQFKIGREWMQYERNNSILPNVSGEFLKNLANEKTSISAQLRHDYQEKEWSNLTEEKMLGILKVNHQLSDSVCVSAGAQSRLLNLLGLSEKDIPLELREQFGYSKKHSLILQAVRDTTLKYYRTVVPLGGTKSNLENEIWQDGFRSTLDFAIFKTLKNGITVKGELSAGVAKSLSGREINHSDRFFIGGQHNLRGFGNNGYGPRDVGCALGGTSMMQLGLHFYSSLDFLSQVTKGFLKNLISPQVALHAFGVAGNVNSPQNILKDFSGFATSFGVGVVIAIVQGLNFEINWVRTSQNKNFKFNSGFTVSI